MHPVAKLVTCTSLRSATSHKFKIPMTFARMVSVLWSSHQSTLGRPVTPAAHRMCVHFERLMSSMTALRSSRRARPNDHLWPCSVSNFPSLPPIQPVRPYTRNTGALSPSSLAAASSAAIMSSRLEYTSPTTPGLPPVGCATSAPLRLPQYPLRSSFLVYHSMVSLRPSSQETCCVHPRARSFEQSMKYRRSLNLRSCTCSMVCEMSLPNALPMSCATESTVRSSCAPMLYTPLVSPLCRMASNADAAS
mmetsp:Transcript_10106/g.43014  ORF Transcript_10106/g.43014 Transcript_10106/m.43014 type:complete len:249 (-) Transcript_10106:771-1517(-)